MRERAQSHLSRRMVFDRWQRARRRLLSALDRLDETLSSIRALGDTQNSPALRTAERVRDFVLGNSRINDEEGALRRLFQFLPADEGPAGPRLVQHLTKYEESAIECEGVVAEQHAVLYTLLALLRRFEAHGGLSASDRSSLRTAALTSPGQAEHLLQLTLRRAPLRAATSEVLRQAAATRLTAGLGCAALVEDSHPATALAIANQLGDVEADTAGVAEGAPDAGARLREQHRRLDAILATALRDADAVTNRTLVAATAWSHERTLMQLGKGTGRPGASRRTLNAAGLGLRTLRGEGGPGWFTAASLKEVATLWRFLSRSLAGRDCPGLDRLIPRQGTVDTSVAATPAERARILITRTLDEFESQLGPVLAAVGTTPFDEERAATVLFIRKRWYLLSNEYRTEAAFQALGKLCGFRDALVSGRRFTEGQASFCYRSAELLVAEWQLWRPDGFDEIQAALGLESQFVRDP
jgi:hypothetical protein